MHLLTSNFAPFPWQHLDYTVVQLTKQDSNCLQALFERCTDFFNLTTGQPPASTAAEAEFVDVPAGKTPEDLHVFGLHHPQKGLIGTIIAVQDYPEAATWWIGTMLIDPVYRSQGVGSAFYQAFERWLAAQGVTGIELCAIASNTSGRAFWQRMGFEEIRQTPSRSFGQRHHIAHVYRRCLILLTRRAEFESYDPLNSLNAYLCKTEVINWQHPDIQALAQQLAAGHETPVVIAQACFEWVRDAIRHSVDYQMNPVTWRASDVLQHKTGYCFAKSHLLAALLRANQIPAGFCYQRLSIDDRGTPYSLHGFNAVYLPITGWHRVDPRGNKPGIDTKFSPPIEHLAYQPKLDEEADFSAILAEPLAIVVTALQTHATWDALLHHLPDMTPNTATTIGLYCY
ncbi:MULTISPECIES: GNAT family N-acetyltransferase [unclassified Synechocystis]|nr:MULTISPECIES: GNAT family N-acetyltransferase [unclassified Synechocystis]